MLNIELVEKKKPKNISDPFINGLLYVRKRDSKFKQRPYLCLTAFSNNARVVYDYLLVPITSAKTIGNRNLVKVTHRKLKKDSYCKLNNMFTVSADDIQHNYEIVKEKFEEKEVKKVIKSLNQLVKEND